MIDLAKIYYFIFGVLTIAGGVMGYITKASTASLVAGGISGVLLLVAGYLVATAKVQPGVILGLIVSLLLAGRFVPAFVKTMSWMPEGLMAILSAIGLVISILALVRR
ncbi:MAG: TMEM14 family protein [Verrucomicrobiota bacterium]|nr:TMEM14 family protein [Verrucomicrobiota bacterium]